MQRSDLDGVCGLLLGKDEVAGSNPAISSRGSGHVESMGLGLFFMPLIE